MRRKRNNYIGFRVRCQNRHCRAFNGRRTLRKHPAEYVTTRGLCKCCGRQYTVDLYRTSKRERRKRACNCGGRPWCHTIGSPFCVRSVSGRAGFTYDQRGSPEFNDWARKYETMVELEKATGVPF